MSKSVHIFVHITVHMLTTTLSDFRRDIKSYLDKVTQGFETLIINRGKDSGVVIISLEEYNSLKATQHEMSSRANEQRLDASIAQLKAGRTVRKKLIEE
jgi:antitoxin YefM